MKKILVLAFALLLAGCAAVVKVEGDQTLNQKMSVKLPEAWNRLNNVGQPYEVWTQEGATIDQLRFWAGLPVGKEIVQIHTPMGKKTPQVPTFKTNMALDELVGLFEAMYSADGSQVKVTRVEPGTFAGANGVRFEFLVTMKKTDLQVRGMGWAAVRNNELYAATYTAPELAFFKRLAPKAQSVVNTASIK